MVGRCRIEIQNGYLGYRSLNGEIEILRNVSMSLCEGDFIAAVGLNGSGKSTLIKSLSGLLPLLQGKILLDGENLNTVSRLEIARKTALVLTEKIQGFNLSLFDLVSSGQMPYTNWLHQLEEEHLKRIDEALEITEIKEFKHKKLQDLSDGTFQKAVIAKALAQQSPVMLLDEPTAFLDYGSKHRLFEFLGKLAREKSKAILTSSHDLDLVRRYCNKILLVSEGSCELLDTHNAFSHPGFQVIGGKYLNH